MGGIVKQEEIETRMRELGIADDDLVEKFIHGSGSGGQKVNKTASCVYLKHLPSGIEIKCQRERSLSLNRFLARAELCDQLEAAALAAAAERRARQEKHRRRNRRPSKAARRRNVANKRKLGEKKKLRRKPKGDE